MSATYEGMSPGGHETYATSIFSKIKTYLDSNPYGYLTTHQDISGKADKSATVSTVTWSNNKLTKTINGTTSDVVSAATILGNLTSSQVTTALGFTPTANIGTITSVKTTAGAHTTINVSSGAANFNVPTKTSHLTNDSGFVTTDEKVKQTPITNQTGAYRILFSRSTDDTEHTEGVYKFSGLTYDPDPSLPEFIFSKKMSDSEDTESPQMRLRLLDSQGVINEELSITSYDIFNQQGWGGDVTVKSLSTILSRKVNKAGDTMSGTLLRDTVDGTSWNMARDHAFIRSHGFADNGSWFPAVSFLTTGGSWAIGSLSSSNNFWFSYTRNNEYTNNINKTDNYQLVPVNDGNAHTYTIAHSGNVGTGDSNGQVKIAGTNVGVKGLGSAAYYNAASTNTASTVVLRDANKYIYAQYYNAGCGADNSATNGSYFVYSNSDGWIRKASRLNFAKALTDSHITSPGFFVSLTNSWGSFGYSTAAETRSAIGAMPVAGGTFTGAVAMKDSNIFRTRLISRNDTGDSGYINFVNTANSAYAPVRSSNFTTMSCKHTKTNVVDISEEDALKLLDIRPVNFDYVEEVGGQKDQIGVLAEDTYEVLPKVVSVPDDYVEEDFDISKGIHQPLPSVDYAKFVPYLIKLVQIQQKEIDILKKERT